MIIERYIIKEVLINFFVIVGILLSIFALYSLTTFLGKVGSESFTVMEIVYLTTLKTFVSAAVLIPLSYFLSIVISFGGLNTHNELVVIRSLGISETFVLSTIITLGIVISIIVAIISLGGRPTAYQKMYQLENFIESRWEFDKVKPKNFYLSRNNSETIYIGNRKNTGSVENVFIKIEKKDGFELVTAPYGIIKTKKGVSISELKLNNATVYSQTNDDTFFAKTELLELQVNTETEVEAEKKIKQKENYKLSESSISAELSEWQWRLSAPISTLVLSFLAFSLVKPESSKNKASKILTAVLLYSAYYITLGFFRTWVNQDVVTSIWYVPLSFSLIAVYLQSIKYN